MTTTNQETKKAVLSKSLRTAINRHFGRSNKQKLRTAAKRGK